MAILVLMGKVLMVLILTKGQSINGISPTYSLEGQNRIFSSVSREHGKTVRLTMCRNDKLRSLSERNIRRYTHGTLYTG